MSRFSAVFLEISTGEQRAGDQRRLSASITSCVRAIPFSLNAACEQGGRLIRLAVDYRRTMDELESLDEVTLRELKIRRSDFRSIAWLEARRQYLQKTLNVTAPLQR